MFLPTLSNACWEWNNGEEGKLDSGYAHCTHLIKLHGINNTPQGKDIALSYLFSIKIDELTQPHMKPLAVSTSQHFSPGK